MRTPGQIGTVSHKRVSHEVLRVSECERRLFSVLTSCTFVSIRSATVEAQMTRPPAELPSISQIQFPGPVSWNASSAICKVHLMTRIKADLRFAILWNVTSKARMSDAEPKSRVAISFTQYVHHFFLAVVHAELRWVHDCTFTRADIRSRKTTSELPDLAKSAGVARSVQGVINMTSVRRSVESQSTWHLRVYSPLRKDATTRYLCWVLQKKFYVPLYKVSMNILWKHIGKVRWYRTR